MAAISFCDILNFFIPLTSYRKRFSVQPDPEGNAIIKISITKMIFI